MNALIIYDQTYIGVFTKKCADGRWNEKFICPRCQMIWMEIIPDKPGKKVDVLRAKNCRKHGNGRIPFIDMLPESISLKMKQLDVFAALTNMDYDPLQEVFDASK